MKVPSNWIVALHKCLDDHSKAFGRVNTIKLFKASILIFLFCYTLQLLSVAHMFFGPGNYMVPYYKSNNIFLKPLNLLEGKQYSAYYLFFLFGLLGSILSYFFLPFKRISLIVCYVFMMNIYHKTAPLQNGGFSLLTIMLFILLFINEESEKTKNPYLRTAQFSIANIGFIAMRMQVVILYMVASYYKLQGESWMDGTAFYYVLYNDLYSHPMFAATLINQTIFIKLVTWFTLLFQLLFPILIWIRKTKKMMLVLGIILHFMIAWVMGIVDFGIIMILMYILFNSESYNTRLLYLFKRNAAAS
jgi:hypothetical protein